jgi:hypothetical protein
MILTGSDLVCVSLTGGLCVNSAGPRVYGHGHDQRRISLARAGSRLGRFRRMFGRPMVVYSFKIKIHMQN